MDIRTFIAIEPDDPARAWLVGWLETLRSRWPRIRWVRPGNLHLTLRFLGDVPEGRIDEVARILAARARPVAPVRLDFAAPGTFGGRRSPRTFWMGFAPGPDLDAVCAFQRGLEEDLVGARFPAEDRPFAAHLTLGRNPGGASAEGWDASLPPWPAGGTPGFPARSAVLFRSDLRPQGPLYTVLAEAPFAGAGARTERERGSTDEPAGGLGG